MQEKNGDQLGAMKNRVDHLERRSKANLKRRKKISKDEDQ